MKLVLTYPFCRIAGHTSEEVREILAALETAYRDLFPQLNLRQWSGSIYTWLTQSLLDPTNSGRVTMDNLMKLVTTALEWTYEAGPTDVQEETLERAVDLLMLRRDTFRVIDGAGPSVDDQGASSEHSAQANLIDEGKASQALLQNLNRILPPSRWKARSSLPHNRNAPSMGKFPLISSTFRRTALIWLNVLIVPAPARFLRTRESSTLNRTSGAKRARLQQNHDGSGAK